MQKPQRNRCPCNNTVLYCKCNMICMKKSKKTYTIINVLLCQKTYIRNGFFYPLNPKNTKFLFLIFVIKKLTYLSISDYMLKHLLHTAR